MQIEVNNLLKEYKRKKTTGTISEALKSMIKPEYEVFRAVDNISFSIGKGEAVGYVGPNGSGKSTTIKMLSGVLRPTAGYVKINGLRPTENRKKINKKIGIVFGNRSVLWWDVPIIESYRVLQRLYEIPEKKFQQNLKLCSEVVGIGNLLDVPERQLSLGQRMRCNIAAAFLHNPEIIFLDEPTIGLDSESKMRIRNFIQKMNKDFQTTFIVTSHDFQDIESLCQRIILINHGQMVVDENIEIIRKKFNKKKQIHFEMNYNPWINKKLGLEGVNVLHQSENTMILDCDIQRINTMEVVDLISNQCEVKDLSINGQDIETIIREIVNEDNKK